MNSEPRRVANQPRPASKDAEQVLRDTRRTLLKLVDIIDGVLTEQQLTEMEDRVTSR